MIFLILKTCIMDSKQYQINSLISAYRKPNTLPKLGSQNDTGPIIKKYTNKFTDGITREKVPIHVQASQEITSFTRKCAPFSSNYKISPIKREEQKESTFFETRQQEKRNFRVRPQTPKLDVIQMSKLKKAKLSKIEEFKSPLQEIPSILKPINGNNSNSFKLSSMAKEEQLLPVYESGSKFGNLPDINAPVVSEAKRSVIKISKRKIKIKKQDFHNLSFTSKGKVEEDTSDEIEGFFL